MLPTSIKKPILCFAYLALVTSSWANREVLIEWTGGKLTTVDYEAFLWGDGDRLLTVNSESSPVSREAVERLFLTAYAFYRCGGNAFLESTRLSGAMKNFFRKYLIWRWLEGQMKQFDPVDDRILKKRYRENIEEFRKPSQFSFRRLFFPVYSIEDEAAKKAVLSQATLAAEKIRLGTSFEDLVEEHNLNRDYLDVLGPFGKEEINLAIEKKIDSLETGEVSEPIELDWGYQVVQIVDKQPRRTIPFFETRAKLLQDYKRDIRANSIQLLLQDIESRKSVAQSDNVSMLFFSRELGRRVGIEEASVLAEAIYSRAVEEGLDRDQESSLVRQWLLCRQIADRLYEQAFETEFEKVNTEKEWLAFYGAHPEKFREASRFLAEFVVAPIISEATSPSQRYLAKWETEQRILSFAEQWRRGDWDPDSSTWIPSDGMHFCKMERPMTYAQAGRQLSEAVRDLEKGEVGSPVFSGASGTFLVARLLEVIPGSVIPFDSQDKRLRRLFLADKRSEFRNAFIREAYRQGRPQWNLPITAEKRLVP